METFKRVVSLLLCFVMLVGVIPFGAMATETTEPETTEVAPVVEEVTDSTDPTGETEEVTDEEHQPAVQADDNLDWVEISAAQNENIFKLVETLTSGKKYVIVNSDVAGGRQALSVQKSGNSYSISKTGVTVSADGSDRYIAVPATTAQWNVNASDNGFTLQNISYNNRYLRYNSGLKADTTSANWTYSENKLSTNVTVQSGGKPGSTTTTTYYLSYSSNNWTANTSGTAVYFYEETTREKVPAVYAAMEGPTAFSFGLTGYDVNTVKGAIKVYTASDAQGTGKTEVTDYTLSGTVNNGTPGTYPLTVQYGGKTLGTVNVTISGDPYVNITHEGEVKNEIDFTNVKVGDKIQLGVTGFTGSAAVTASDVQWSIVGGDASIATVDNNGLVTVRNNNTRFEVKVVMTTSTGVTREDTVVIGVSSDNYLTPNISSKDFPDYPDEGAIRYDKTAQAVGNFSSTGVAQLELSMTGIPYVTGGGLDVVIMLDHSNSMTEDRMAATRGAVKAFLDDIVKNDDGSFNGNRVYIGSFAGGNPEYLDTQSERNRHYFRIYEMTTAEEDGYQIINDATELANLKAEIDRVFIKITSNTTAIHGTNTPYGTEYDQSLEKCYDILKASKDDNRQQFCVFMSDGIPNVYRYGQNENDKIQSSANMVAMFASNAGKTFAIRDTDYKYEYWSSKMKDEGITVFTVGLGLKGTNSSLGSSYSAEECERVSNFLLNDISGPAGEAAADRDTGTTVSKLNEYFFSVTDESAASGMKDVFDDIAEKITDAATDIVVTDKIADEYTMIFGIPQTETNDASANDRNNSVKEALKNQELYIEVIEYALNQNNHERTGATNTLTRVYLKDSNGTTAGGTYSAATNAAGAAAPALTMTAASAPAYWAVVNSNYIVGENDIVINLNGTYYKFMEKGDGTHNATGGAYAFGNIDAKTNMSEDLVIVTPYFAYSAATKMLAWTAEKVEEFKELAVRYFLYLDHSSTEVGTNIETPAGTYDTNEWAYMTYTNHLGNLCRQEFPIPHMTWNGAQVSYVFYLVNSAGQPINKQGVVVDFANAVFVTDVFTKSIVWNDAPTVKPEGAEEGVAYLDAQWKAEEMLPEGYTLFDLNAYYELLVYEDAEGNTLKSYFKIDGSKTDLAAYDTTKVYITKGDQVKYSAYGTYSEGDVHSSFDFANTTVAFAVVWERKLVPDTVVVDFGLDVLINPVQNDLMQNSVDGISFTAPVGTANTVAYNEAQLTKDAKTIGGNTISVEEGGNLVRFHQGDMVFNEPVTFYYESAVTYYTNSEPSNGYMYSSVTVIPATTIYYEDSFLTLESYTNVNGTYTKDGTSQWIQEGGSVDATQQQDRPGKSQISAALDADNNYGYDSAYTQMSEFSMGSSASITINGDVRGEATFTFVGTGFDVIGLTSNTTGTLIVQVFNAQGTAVKSTIVDTYYGYAYEEGQWVAVDSNSPNALYQVPVMKIAGLEYGQYNVKLIAGYNQIFDHTTDGKYTLYLDAIRIYDPTGNQNDIANDAYAADGEYMPTYTELRNLIIKAATYNDLGVGTINGITFIDGATNTGAGNTASVVDYTNYGPNNELYLAHGQAVAFNLSKPANMASIQLGIKTVGGDSHIQVYSVDSDGKVEAMVLNQDVKTATDLYYDITAMAGKTVVIKNTGGENGKILSLTNIKTTYVKPQTETTDVEPVMLTVSRSTASYALMSLRAPVVEEEEPSVPETTVPETTEPETKPVFAPAKFEVKVSKDSIKEGEHVDVTVTTSSDVASVSINGEMVKGKHDKKKDIYTWTSKIKTDASHVGTMTIEVVAYDKNGVASETETVNVTVASKFEVKVSKTSVKEGDKVDVTVTTGSNVASVSVDGEMVKGKHDKKQDTYTWTAKIKTDAKDVGTKTIKVVAYGEDGEVIAEETVEVTVTAKNNKGGKK